MTSTEAQPAVTDEHLTQTLCHARDIVVRALELYGPGSLAFSFNGGKDSTAVLHVLLEGVQAWCQQSSMDYTPMQGLLGIHTFFFLHDSEFPEVHEFVKEMDAKYNLRMHTYTCGFKEGLLQMVGERGVKAVFLGTRIGDPNCQDQDFFCPSSKGWPPFMRINPVLNWAYGDVWAYLRHVGAAVCPLYYQGYTSIGSTKDTAPNASLLRSDGTYAPAHELADGRLERSGRRVAAIPQRQNSRGPEHAPTAAIVLIGDELLAGKVVDANFPFLGAELHALGWKVLKVVIVPDNIDSIAREVKAVQREVDVVITCGGVGPTADDCTMDALALAVGGHTATDAGMEAALREYFGSQVSSSHLKMARVVEGRTELLPYESSNGKPSIFPLMKVENVYVLPGVPSLVRAKWPALRASLEKTFGASTAAFRNRLIQVKSKDEAAIAPVFERIVEEFPDVSAGSYPQVTEGHGEIVAISLESKDGELLERASQRYVELLHGSMGAEQEGEDTVIAVKADVALFN